MKIYVATVWWDLMDDDPVVFVHPDETLLESQIWAEFNAKYGEDFEPYAGEVALAIDHAGGRVVFDEITIPGYGIVSHETLNNARQLLLEYEEEREMDLENPIDEDQVNTWEADIRYSKEVRTKIEEAIK